MRLSALDSYAALAGFFHRLKSWLVLGVASTIVLALAVGAVLFFVYSH